MLESYEYKYDTKSIEHGAELMREALIKRFESMDSNDFELEDILYQINSVEVK